MNLKDAKRNMHTISFLHGSHRFFGFIVRLENKGFYFLQIHVHYWDNGGDFRNHNRFALKFLGYDDIKDFRIETERVLKREI